MPNVGEAMCRQGSGVPYAAASLIKPAGYNVGDFIRLGSKTFVLAKTGGAITSVGLGCKNGQPQGADQVVLGTAAEAGAKTVNLVTSATSGMAGTGLTAVDEYAGGEIVLFKAGVDRPQRRGIVGNTARAATGAVAVTFTLDSPLSEALDSTDVGEAMASPWAYVTQDNEIGHPVVGVPMVAATAALMYMWLQVWGPCFASPQAACGIAGATGLYWRHDGSLDVENADAYVSDQYAGYVLAETIAHTQAAPFFMLQICP